MKCDYFIAPFSLTSLLPWKVLKLVTQLVMIAYNFPKQGKIAKELVEAMGGGGGGGKDRFTSHGSSRTDGLE